MHNHLEIVDYLKGYAIYTMLRFWTIYLTHEKET